ncbi:Metallo peptidase M14 [Heterobasidion irregulare TC 32-1]|uniref:Metallo peptidase M14 n=1 Tax=Heterobasidion irregulare (strain TC 32-1) TaxID=747525 RepID=W4JQH3_HETIT|nr:Metallo peptidase M14 [Heterobasidion irregulare TC 32-1]ETW75141.1 Metallo peptidase M14 [Heterobasidion irregulare TC 32-1]
MYAEGGLLQDWNLPSLSNTTYHASYHTLDDIYGFLRDLAAVYPDKVKIIPLGHTGESRELYALEIGSSNTKSHDPKGETSTNEKLSFLITGTQHAREWVASAAALYLAHALAANASEPNSLTHLLDDYNFYIIAVPNPDGYVYTWEHDRFWYKNRLYLGPHAQCVGLDMNRNWGYKFKSGSVKMAPSAAKPKDSCSHWYPGHRPFQAPEVNNIALYIESLPTFDAFVDLRSYGQMLSAPYSYSCNKSPKDAEDQLEAASGAAYAVRKSHGTGFTTGTLCSTLYRAPGNIVDWMYATMGVKYSYAAHLRDTGTYGFALPPQWIRPVGEETAKIVEYLARFIANKQKKVI